MGILGELWVKLGLKNEGLNKGLEQSKQKVNGFAQYMGKLGGIIAGAFSVKAIVDFTKQAAELSNKAKGVRVAFERLGDPSLLANLRKATQGTVDDLQLMQRAVQAQNFGIPVKNLATYLEFATKRARETGQSVDYLVDSIITGLGRQSVLILDNLGISAAEIRDKMKDGGSMADAVGEIIKKSMSESATEINNTALATERLSAAWTNFTIAVGDKTSGIWNTLKGEAASMLSFITRIMNAEGFSTAEKIGMLTGGVNSRENWDKLLAQEEAKKKRQQQAQELAQERVSKVKNLNDALKEQEFLERELEKHAGRDNVYVEANKIALQQIKQYIEEQKKKQAEDAKEQQLKNSLIGSLQKEIEEKEKIRNLSANEDEVRQLNDEIAALKEKLKILQMTSEEYKKYQESLDKSLKKVDGVFDVPKIKANTDAGLEILNQGVEAWKARNAKAVEQQAVNLEAINMMNEAITSGITSSLGELANMIAGVEGANVGNVVKALLSPLADAAIAAGLLIMTTGKGIEALKTSLIDFFGGSAIVAGAALMAVGVAAKAGLASIGRNGARGAGGYGNNSVTSYSGGYGVNSNNYAQATSAYTLTTTLKGQDLLLAIQRTENNNRR